MALSYEKSFAINPVSKYWSPNNVLKPHEVALNSHSKFLFKCPNCNHEYEQVLYTIKNKYRCPYCSSPPKNLCSDMDCIECYNKSFSSYEKSKYWYDNNIIPRFVFKFSTKKYKFKCNECNHIFIDTPNHISSNRWCPYCSIPTKLLCNDIECLFCLNKSFAIHPMAKNWSNKNSNKPREVTRFSNKKYIFNCNICLYEFNVSLNSILYNIYCPLCINKTEKILYKWLSAEYDNIIYQPRYNWCKNKNTNKILPFDFEYKKYNN